MQHGHDASPAEAPLLYADVLVPRHISKTFTYRVPPPLQPIIAVGHRVLVPFGRATLEAAVVSLSRQHPAGVGPASLKEIASLLDQREGAADAAALFELSRRVAEDYVAPWGQCLRLIFPTPRGKTPSRYLITEQGRAALQDGRCPETLRPVLTRIARRATGVSSSTLLSAHDGSTRTSIETLERHGWIAAAARREASGKKRQASAPGLRLEQFGDIGPAQAPSETWVHCIEAALRARPRRRIVLHAPWSERLGMLSDAVLRMHANKQSVLVLCGESAKAEWLGRRVTSLTGLPIQLLSERRDGAAAKPSPIIVVGTRSAVFTPVPSIGLLWVEGEDDPAFKELKEPRYHARQVACIRGDIEGALVVLASAHPSLESKYEATDRTAVVEVPAVSRPAIELVDLRREPPGTLLSPSLAAAMQTALETKAGVFLFLNRKGYAGALVCGDCGWVLRCRSCAVALVYYRETAKLACRYCGEAERLPELCPTCGAARLNPVGEGTERVELEVRRLFPQAAVARLDGDTLRNTVRARRLWQQLYGGSCDVIIGTQAVLQRGPLPQMGVVGVIQADSGLHASDFRAAERTYQLLIDAVAAGRPASAGGRVVLQTLLPEHHAIASIVLDEPNRFYEEELAARRLLGYPPALQLVNLSVTGKQVPVVETAARMWRTWLEQWNAGEHAIAILGPVPALGGRARGYHRCHMLVKGADRLMLRRAVRESVDHMESRYPSRQVKFIVDVDPVDMG
jgi:primosomal protein N' (replication factor Y)